MIYRWILLAVIEAVLLGIAYYRGGVAPRRELEDLRVQSVAFQAEAKSKEAASKTLVDRKDKEYATSLDSVTAQWNDWMRNHPNTPAVQPVQISTEVCGGDSGERDGLSGAIQDYLNSVAQFRTEVEELLKQSDSQSAALQCVRDWADSEQLIHQE